jgi:hypothetical protein
MCENRAGSVEGLERGRRVSGSFFFVCFRGTIEGRSVDEAVGGGVKLTGKSEDVYSCRRSAGGS